MKKTETKVKKALKPEVKPEGRMAKMMKGRNSTIPRKNRISPKKSIEHEKPETPRNRTVTNFRDLMNETRANYWFDKNPHFPEGPDLDLHF